MPALPTLLCIILLLLASCGPDSHSDSGKTTQANDQPAFGEAKTVYQTDRLEIVQIAKGSYIHISYLDTKNFGKVPCNGMLSVSADEALIFDTPSDSADAEELINWLTTARKLKIVGVVVNHFHVDCLGSLEVFHTKGIPSYANALTQTLAQKDSVTVPTNTWQEKSTIKVGNMKIESRYLGGGHTQDNIVSYNPVDQVLFGGCMIKAIGAGKGNTADANLEEWAKTVSKVKQNFPDAELIIPGHGKHGGRDLLDYTIEMFH